MHRTKILIMLEVIFIVFVVVAKGTLTRISALEEPELRDKTLPGSLPTTILKEIPAAYTIPYGDIVYVENDGRCSQGEVIKITGGHGGRGIHRKYECVKRPLVQAQPPFFDFSGIWSAPFYQCVDPQPPQYVVIKIEDGDVTATKLTGDSCIRAGEVTWRGKYKGNPFPGQMSGRRPGQTFWSDVMIRIVDENTINVSGGVFTRVEVPSPLWVLQRKVPMSGVTLERLTKIAESISTEDRKVSPMQVAAQLLEDSLRRPPTGKNRLPIDTPKVDTPKVDTTVDASVYDDYVGKYAYAILTVTQEGDRLFAQLTRQRKFEIFPKSETEFFWKVVDAQVTFVKNDAGVVTHARHRQVGEFEAPKIK